MSVLPTPILREADFDKNMLRGYAMSQLAILRQQLKLGKLVMGERRLDLGGGVKILCRICYNLEEVFLELPKVATLIEQIFTGEFICHPRIGPIYATSDWGDVQDEPHEWVYGGGWSDLKYENELSGRYAYPLVDNDHGSFILAFDSSIDKFSWKKDKENYGNIDWKGPKMDSQNDQSKRKVLTWKGPPSRHFPMPIGLHVPGLTQVDTVTVQGWNYTTEYTPLGISIYERGEAIATGPKVNYPRSYDDVSHQGQIVGAAYHEATGKLLAIVKAIYTERSQWWTVDVKIIATRVTLPMSYHDNKQEADTACSDYAGYYLAADYSFSVVQHDRPGTGYWYELYEASGSNNGEFYTYLSQNGWKFLARMQAPERPKVPWFFNESGTEAVCVAHNLVMQCHIAVSNGSLSATFDSASAIVKNNQQEAAQPHGKIWDLRKQGEWVVAADWQGNDLVTLTATHDVVDTSDENTIVTDVKEWITVPFHISLPSSYNSGPYYGPQDAPVPAPKTSYGQDSTIVQQRAVQTRVTLNGKEIVLRDWHRSFIVNHKQIEHYTPTGADGLWNGMYVEGPMRNLAWPGIWSYPHHGYTVDELNLQLTEDAWCRENIIYYLDLRHNLMLRREQYSTLKFDTGPTANKSYWREMSGNVLKLYTYLPPDKVHKTTTDIITIKGVDTQFTTSSSTYETGDFAIVMSAPGSWSTPVDPNMFPHGFYDFFGDNYYEKQGGSDWYYPTWVQLLTDNRSEELDDAANRFYCKVTQPSFTLPVKYIVPKFPSESFPCGSIAVDRYDNIFFSVLQRGTKFSRLITAEGKFVNLAELTKLTVGDTATYNQADEAVFYPIAPL